MENAKARQSYWARSVSVYAGFLHLTMPANHTVYSVIIQELCGLAPVVWLQTKHMSHNPGTVGGAGPCEVRQNRLHQCFGSSLSICGSGSSFENE
jgi:hypothetical protein